MTIIKKENKGITSVDEDKEKGALVHCWWESELM